MEKKETKGFYIVFEWITKFAFLNVVWIVLIIICLGVFGFIPATASLFSIVRKWLQKEEVPIMKTCWKVYKRSFFALNKIGIIFITIWSVLFYSFMYYLQFNLWITKALSVVLIILLVVLLLMVIYIFPLYAEYEMRNIEYVKTACTLVVLFPFSSIFLFVIIVGSLSLIKIFPGFIFFYGSIISYLIMFHTLR